ncbi:hypothetical protein ACFLV2_01540 [Chloroflexota bacterium]
MGTEWYEVKKKKNLYHPIYLGDDGVREGVTIRIENRKKNMGWEQFMSWEEWKKVNAWVNLKKMERQ